MNVMTSCFSGRLRLALGRNGRSTEEKRHLEDALVDFDVLTGEPGYEYRAKLGRSVALARLGRQSQRALRILKASKEVRPSASVEPVKPGFPDLMYGRGLAAQKA